MKKTIVSLMMSIALLAGGTAFAQNQSDGNTGATVQKENVKGGKAQKGKKDGNRMKGNRPAFNPFDGIQLTDDQQQKLQVLRQGLGPVVLDQQQQENIPENPNLTPEQKKQLREEKRAKQMENKKNYLNGVKETLTPDQYVIFLENCYLYTPQYQGKDTGMKANQKVYKSEKGGKDKKNKKDRHEKKK